MAGQKRNFDYKWVILSTCFLMIFVALGFCSGTKSLYLAPITEALGISRSLYALNDSCRHIATAIINLFFGTLIYRLGIKKMIAVGFLSLLASTLCYAYADSVLVLCIAGTLLGCGVVFTSTTMVSVVIRRWCTTNLGKYTGIVLAANGIGAAVASQILSPIINRPGDAFAYRDAYLVTAAILVVTAVIVLLLIREKPANESAITTTVSKKKPKGAIWAGIAINDAKKRPYFYLTCGSILLTGMMLQGIGGVFAAHMKDVGIDPTVISTAVSIKSLVLTCSKLLVGYLYDRFGLRTVMLTCHCYSVASFILFVLIAPTPIGIAFAFAFAIMDSLALPLETVVIPLMTNDMFGSHSYEKILGIFMAMNYSGYALGSPVVNLFYDLTGSYIPVMLVLAGIMTVILIVFQFNLTAAYRDKKKIIA